MSRLGQNRTSAALDRPLGSRASLGKPPRGGAIPHYALYGDQAAPAWLDMVHFERIHERSSLFHFDIAPHVHDGLVQLLVLTDGAGHITIDGAQWQVQAPALILVPARSVHAFKFSTDVDGPVLTAAQRPLESLAAVAAPALLDTLRRPCVMGIADSPRHLEALLPLCEALARETALQSAEGPSAGQALLLAVLVQVARVARALQPEGAASAATAAAAPVALVAPDTASAAPRSAPRSATPSAANTARSRKAAQVERFRAAVDAGFRQRLAVTDYAAQLGISAGQLSRLCREQLGISAQQVVNQRVLHDAERELVYSTLSIKQIAALLGFADEGYFGRFFKTHSGLTPGEFRAQAHARL